LKYKLSDICLLKPFRAQERLQEANVHFRVTRPGSRSLKLFRLGS